MSAPLIPIDALTKALTVDEIKASIYSALATTGVSTTVWKPGAVVRTFIAIVAVVIAALSNLAALASRSGWISLASGAWLTLAAKYDRNVERQEATFASGTILLSNSSGFTYTIDPDDLTVTNSTTGKSYRSSEGVTLNPGDLNIPCAAVAVESGSASTAFEGEIDTVGSGFTGVTVTNAVAFVGLDAQEDPELQTLCDEKLGSLSPNGPSDGYRYFAKIAKRADGTPIGITRVRVVPALDLSLDVYCATASGGVTGTQDDASTDLGAVHDLLQRNCVPIPITQRTHSATLKPIDVTYSVWLYNSQGLTEADIKEGIATAIADLIPVKPIGGDVIPPASGFIYQDHIRAAIVAAKSPAGVPMGIFHCVVSSPAADVPVATYEAPTVGTVGGSVTQLAPPQGSI